MGKTLPVEDRTWFHKETVRTARHKSHTCSECTQQIPRGSKYAEVYTDIGLLMQRYVLHLECNSLRASIGEAGIRVEVGGLEAWMQAHGPNRFRSKWGDIKNKYRDAKVDLGSVRMQNKKRRGKQNILPIPPPLAPVIQLLPGYKQEM